MKEIEKLKPFTRFLMTIGEIPSSYLISMTYEEQLLCFCNYLKNTVIPALNNNAEAVVELQNFITNYFKNLDVQEEINNKLDEMATDGTLEEIIAAYLNTQAILGFNTVTELKAADNIIDGSIVRTLGNTTYNDGYGAFYKIRTVTSGDVVDEENILSLSVSNTLIAEKIPNATINSILSDINDIQTQIDNELTEIVTFGDSWTMNNYPYIEDQNKMWNKIVAKRLNLNLHNYAISAAGFTITNNTILNQINTAVADTNLNRNKVKYVIYYGGINDLNAGTWNDLSDLNSAIDTTFSAINTNFPKSNIIICGANCGYHLMNGVNHQTTSIIDIRNCLLEKAQKYGFAFIDSVPFLFGQPDTIDSETGHPSESGQITIASKILSGINGTPYSPIYTDLTPYIYNPTNPSYSGNVTRVLINGLPKSSNLMNCQIGIAVNGTTVPSGSLSFNFKELKPAIPSIGKLYQGLYEVGDFSFSNDGTLHLFFTTNLQNTNTIVGRFDIEI